MSFKAVAERQAKIARQGKPTVQKLLQALPEEDSNALRELFSNPVVKRDDLWRIIQDQAESYPDIDPSLFQVTRTDVRDTCAEVRGL